MKIITKRVISVIIAFLIGVIIALFGWHLLHEEGLTDEELIGIALNDSRVQAILTKEAEREGISNLSYEIGGIIFMEY